jgi:GNAT superfamily N-acetyltransferase
VSEGQRRFGRGRVLVDEAEKWVRQREAEEMRLDIWEFDDGPLRFYEKRGYWTLRREMIRRFEHDDRERAR